MYDTPSGQEVDRADGLLEPMGAAERSLSAGSTASAGTTGAPPSGFRVSFHYIEPFDLSV